MNKICVVLLAALFSFSGTRSAQDVMHAPAVEQCRADMKLWSAEIGTPSPDQHTIDSKPAETREMWGDEMSKCAVIDHDAEYNDGYDQLSDMANLVVTERMWNSLARHGLYQKIPAEDRGESVSKWWACTPRTTSAFQNKLFLFCSLVWTE